MRVLFAVSNNENSNTDIVDAILNEYQRMYKKIISYKRAFYYDAIINEIKSSRDNQYDIIVISEDLEKKPEDGYDAEDRNLYRHMDEITDEAYKEDGTGIPIILICNDRRSERDAIIPQLFSLGMYNILYGKDRTIQNVCALIERPRNKKKAKMVYNINPKAAVYVAENAEKKISDKELLSILKFFNLNKANTEKCVKGFSKLYKEYKEDQLNFLIENLPIDIKIILEENSKEYLSVAKERVIRKSELNNASTLVEKNLTRDLNSSGSEVIIPGQQTKRSLFGKKN